MRTITIIIAITLITNAIQSQQQSTGELKSGKVTYEETAKLNIRIEGDAAQFAANLPKERKVEKVLSFNSDAALFEDGVNVEDDMEAHEGEGVRIRMVASGQNKTYTDLRNSIITDQRDFMNRIFLVEREMPSFNWKITGNQKSILGYQCMEAVKQDTAGIKTVAWFAPSIPVKTGPAGLCNLPGLILEADIDNGQRTFFAKTVTPFAPGEDKIKKPQEGKKVNETEYAQIVDEKMKEMGIEGGHGQGGGGTHMQIVIKKQ